VNRVVQEESESLPDTMNEDGDPLGLQVYNRIELIRGMIVPNKPIT